MAESETEISQEELQKEIAEILDNASLENTSTKKVIQKLEKKLGMDLSEKKKLIDQLVMDYVNSLDSEESMDEEEKKVPQKTAKKDDLGDDDDEDDEQDDRNDSDYGYHRDSDVFLDGSSEENYRPLPQESTITTSRGIHPLPVPNRPKKAIILKRVSQPISEEDECDIFGKLTAKKLRKLPEEKRDSMMIQINQMFYEKRYGRPILSPNRTQEHIAIPSSTALHLTPTQIQAKRIYPLNTIPTVVKSSTYVSPAGNVPAAVVLPSNNVPTAVPAAVPVTTSTQPVANSGKKKKVAEKKKKAAPKAKKAKKGSTKKTEGGVTKRRKGGYTKTCKLSPALAELMGESELPRHEVVKRVWAIIKEKQLYDPKNRQYAICDKALFKVIGEQSFHTFSMMKYLKNHFLD